MPILPDNTIQNNGIILGLYIGCCLSAIILSRMSRNHNLKLFNTVPGQHRFAECIGLTGNCFRINCRLKRFAAHCPFNGKLELRFECLCLAVSAFLRGSGVSLRLRRNGPIIVFVHYIQNQGFRIANGNRRCIQISRILELAQRTAVITNDRTFPVYLVISSGIRIRTADVLCVLFCDWVIRIGIKNAVHRSAHSIVLNIEVMSPERFINGTLRQDILHRPILNLRVTLRGHRIEQTVCRIISFIIKLGRVVFYFSSAGRICLARFLQKAVPLTVCLGCRQMILCRNKDFLSRFIHFHAL